MYNLNAEIDCSQINKNTCVYTITTQSKYRYNDSLQFNFDKVSPQYIFIQCIQPRVLNDSSLSSVAWCCSVPRMWVRITVEKRKKSVRNLTLNTVGLNVQTFINITKYLIQPGILQVSNGLDTLHGCHLLETIINIYIHIYNI